MRGRYGEAEHACDRPEARCMLRTKPRGAESDERRQAGARHTGSTSSRGQEQSGTALQQLGKALEQSGKALQQSGKALQQIGNAYFPSSKRHFLAAVGIFPRIFPESENEGGPLISLKKSGISRLAQHRMPSRIVATVR